MILGTGIDLLKVSRIKKLLDNYGDIFVKKVFSEYEIKKNKNIIFKGSKIAKSFATKEAFVKASDLLVEHFESFGSPRKEKKVKAVKSDAKKAPKAKKEAEEVAPDLTILDLKLSPRTLKALQENRIKAIKNLAKKSEEQLLTMSGLGEKGVKEIKREIGKLGILLKTDEASF